jgi:hypothetical protein
MLAGSGTGAVAVVVVVVPATKVSGPVPKENVAAVTVVLAVIPERSRTNVAGPIV